MLHKIKNKLSRSSNRKRDNDIGSVYAVLHGSYGGQYIVVIDKDVVEYKCLLMPDNKCLDIPIDKFTFATDNNILDFIETVPNNITSVCRAQYNKSLASTPLLDRKPHMREEKNEQDDTD